MKHFVVSIFIMISLIFSLLGLTQVNAGFGSDIASRFTPTKPVWGKVLITPMPGYVCTGVGTSMFLNSQISGAVGAAKGAAGIGSSGGVERSSAVAGGLLNMIPTYAKDPLKRPKIGGYVLGLNNAIPNFTLCKIGNYPVPIYKTTDTFGVSGGLKAITKPNYPKLEVPPLNNDLAPMRRNP